MSSNELANYTDSMKKRSTKELLQIIYLIPYQYTLPAIQAAESEIYSRKHEKISELKDKLIEDNFEDLSIYTDDEIADFIVKKKMTKKIMKYFIF